MIKTNPFSSRNIIGYVSEVSAGEVKIHFPDSSYLNRFHNHGKSYHGGIVGSYVVIEGETKGYLGKFIKVSLPSKDRKELTEEKYKNSDFQPVGIVELLFSFDLISFDPEKSINNFPSVGEKVYVTNSEFYLDLVNKDKDDYTEDDKLLIGEDLEDGSNVKLSANKLFSRHCAIVGTTGGGKSYTVSKVIEQLIENEGAKVLLLDPTGEFSSLDNIKKDGEKIVESFKFNNGDSSIYFDYKNFTFNELTALFKPAGQVQNPKLEDTIKSLKVSFNKENGKIIEDDLSPEIKDGYLIKKNKSESLLNRYLYQNSDLVNSYKMNIDIMKLSAQMSSQEFFWVNDDIFGKKLSASASEINGKEKDNCSSLILRIGNIINNIDLQKIFNFKQELLADNSFEKIFESFYSKNNRLLRLDCSEIPEEKSISEILINAIGNYLLNKSKEIKSGEKGFKIKPLIVFIDEAHLFLGKTIKDEYSIEVELNAFERIAKECRKYGLFICIATQRPRDIPEGILSQMGTFIVHRLINDKDKSAIENAVSNYNKSFLNFLPSLGKGEALIMGVEFLTTLFLRIKKTEYPPNSDTPRLFDKQKQNEEKGGEKSTEKVEEERSESEGIEEREETERQVSAL